MNKARYNEVLTEKAKVIFGDIVTKVFIVADEHEVERLDRCDYEYTKSKDDDIDTDNFCDLVICFKNGKKVQFNFSEWGTISTAAKFEVTDPQTEENDSTF